MSNIRDFNSVLAVKLLLERKDHDHLANVFFDLLYPSSPPRPYLRTDKVEDRNSKLMKFARQTKIEFGKINENGSVRPALLRFGNELVEPSKDSRQMRDHFRQPNDRDFLSVNQQLAAGNAHRFATHTEERRSRRKL